MSRRSKKEVIARYNHDPYCPFCGVKMKFYGTPTVVQPDDQVTVDHVFPIGTAKRTHYKAIKRPSPWVLACYKCNHERGSMEFHKFKRKKKTQIKQEHKDEQI